MLTVRPANPSDVSILNTLIHEMADYERLPAAITEQDLARDGFGQRPEFSALMAEWDGQPAGYAFFFYCYSTFRGRGLFLEDVFVRAQFRGKKVGEALFARVAGVAKAEDCFGVMLNVLDWNHPAIEFFGKYKVRFLNDWKTACLDGDALHAVGSE
jgi:GNAT superfamily N-acetyltransferase